MVAFARAIVERAADRQLDAPTPGEDRIGADIVSTARNSIDPLS
jgi:hypothetical protein